MRVDTDRVLDVALETFLAAGVANTTMTGIARACGLSRGALYLRFSGKEEIFRAAVEHAWDKILTQAAAADVPGEDLEDCLRRAVLAKLDLWMSIPSLTYAQEIIDSEFSLAGDINTAKRQEYRSILEGIIRNHADAGTLAENGVEVHTIAEIIEAWLTSVRARPGTAEANNAYISDCLRFFTVQIRAAAPR